jgi:DnaK suppressor protein
VFAVMLSWCWALTLTQEGAVELMANTIHYEDLRRMLIARRHELLDQIQSNLRDAREDASSQHHYPGESGETTEVHPEEELAFVLIQMKTELLNRINEAVSRLEEGTYGYCGECGDPITMARLRALPFAVRCKDCEEMREQSEPREHVHVRAEWRRC